MRKLKGWIVRFMYRQNKRDAYKMVIWCNEQIELHKKQLAFYAEAKTCWQAVLEDKGECTWRHRKYNLP